MEWKNIKAYPPISDCVICLKIGSCYETYSFKRYNEYSWSLYKYPRTYEIDKIPDFAEYIILDQQDILKTNN